MPKELYKEIKETVFEFVDVDDVATFTTSDRKWKTKVGKLLEKYPDQIKLVAENEDGSVCINCPKNWFKLNPPKKMSLTEEQRKKLSERIKALRNKE